MELVKTPDAIPLGAEIVESEAKEAGAPGAGVFMAEAEVSEHAAHVAEPELAVQQDGYVVAPLVRHRYVHYAVIIEIVRQERGRGRPGCKLADGMVV